MHLGFRKSCRVCGSTALTPVINLGDQYLQGSFVKPGKEMPPLRKIPLVLVRCDPTKDENACGLLQMEHTVPPEVLYSSYWYRSGTNNTMRTHLRDIVEEAVSIVNKSGGSVLDIGCNDGTLLSFYPHGFRKYGVDPSDIAQEIDRQERERLSRTFSRRMSFLNCLQGTQIDIITSIAMFYDLEDPVAFAKGIKSILSSEGIWIFEMSYMPMMLKMTSYDTFCHEHLEFYSLAVIEYILKKSDLKIFNVKKLNNGINGGSIRCYATHTTNFKYKKEDYLLNIRAMHQAEFDFELDTDKPYKNFQDRINVHRDELSTLLKKLKMEGKKIHIYGASTKGNTILQWCGIDNRIIDYAAERNPTDMGHTRSERTFQLLAKQSRRDMKPDYYLVLPWHFKEEFIARERDILERGRS